MSDKENDSIQINQSSEFQTFSKNYKDTNKNKKNIQVTQNNDNYEFTFKKNLFQDKNITSDINQEHNTFLGGQKNEKDVKLNSVLNETNKFKENKHIFKKLFPPKIKKVSEKIIKTGITNKSSIINPNSSNKYLILLNKIKRDNNKINDITKCNSVIYNQKNKNKYSIIPLIQKYISKKKSNINNINNNKNKKKPIEENISKNHSFICPNNLNEINHNNYALSYKTKMKIKKKMSTKNMNLMSENNKEHFNYSSFLNSKLMTQKNINTYNNLNKDKNIKKKNIIKIDDKNILQNKKSQIFKEKNKLNLVKKNKFKTYKSPLSTKNQIRNNYLKFNNKNNYRDFNAYSNLGKIKNNSINKINCSILIKKNKTFINLIHNDKKKSSKNVVTNNERKKLTPDKFKF